MNILIAILLIISLFFSPLLESIQILQMYYDIENVKFISQLPYVVKEPGTYILNLVEVDPNNQTIIIDSDNVTLDGKELFIPRPPLPPILSCGIVVENRNNVVIKNVRVSKCFRGIIVKNVNNLVIENVELSNIYEYGIRLERVRNAKLSNIVIKSSFNGLLIRRSRDVVVRDALISSNGVSSGGKSAGLGISVSYSSNVLIEYTNITNNADGISVSDSINVLIKDSIIVNKYREFIIHGSRQVITYYSEIKTLYPDPQETQVLVQDSYYVSFFLNIIDESTSAEIIDSSRSAFYSIDPVVYLYEGKEYVGHLGNYYPEWLKNQSAGGGRVRPPPVMYGYDIDLVGSKKSMELFGKEGVMGIIFNNSKGIVDLYPLAYEPSRYILSRVPLPPQNLTVENRHTYVYLTWSPPEGIDVVEYEIYRKEEPDSEFKYLGSTNKT